VARLEAWLGHRGGVNGEEATLAKRDRGEWAAVDVQTSQGTPIADAIRSIGGDGCDARSSVEPENARLRKAISDVMLDKLIFQEAARGND